MQIAQSMLNDAGIAQLRRAVTGDVIDSDHPDYDAARSVYIRSFDRRPSLIVRVRDAADVMRVLEVARDTGCPLAVRSGGHSLAGHSVCEGGIVLDVTALRSLEIDGSARIARAGAGLTAGEYTRATCPHGLATGYGDAPTAGSRASRWRAASASCIGNTG